jgi:4-nitrophenyl phosphatase
MKRSCNGWNEPLGSVEGFMFDLDGTLILSARSLGGYRLLPGAIEILSELKNRGIPFVTLTNGSHYPPAEQAAKLRTLGLPIADEALLTPSSVAADLMPRRGVKRALILGTPGVGHALSEAGIETFFTGQEGADRVEAVYIGWHPDCNMKDIEAAAKAIWNGAELYCASDVPFFATSEGRTMGYSHAIAGAVRKVTRAPMILTGKPSLHALRLVARKLGVKMRRVGVVGDDPVVEMIMARRGGATGFGVTTGMTTAEGWATQPKARRPHRVLHDVREILAMLDKP